MKQGGRNGCGAGGLNISEWRAEHGNYRKSGASRANPERSEAIRMAPDPSPTPSRLIFCNLYHLRIFVQESFCEETFKNLELVLCSPDSFHSAPIRFQNKILQCFNFIKIVLASFRGAAGLTSLFGRRQRNPDRSGPFRSDPPKSGLPPDQSASILINPPHFLFLRMVCLATIVGDNRFATSGLSSEITGLRFHLNTYKPVGTRSFLRMQNHFESRSSRRQV